jgi:hypothetical protein
MAEDQINYLDLLDLTKLIEQLENKYKRTIICNSAILKESISKINDYLNKFQDPSAYKVSGATTFWIRKLKLFSFETGENDYEPTLYLNEQISVFYGYNYLRAYKKNAGTEYPKLSSKFLIDLIVQLRYSSFSPSSIEMLFWALCHEK